MICFNLTSFSIIIIIALIGTNHVFGSFEITDEIKFENSKIHELQMSECHLRKVVHILQHPGCLPKPIPSYACFGTCSSYVQVSNSKFWQVERSCNCCQEIGEREALISLICPRQYIKLQKIITRAPQDCICRPCSAVDHREVKPQETLI